MRPVNADTLAARGGKKLFRCNAVFESFFKAEARHEMSRGFLAGGRLLAFGNGSAAIDGQRVSVEFVPRHRGPACCAGGPARSEIE